MSFRNRLTVFFIVLVILPMIVVAAVGVVLASDSEQGKTDARLSEAQRSASGLFREEQDEAGNAALAMAHDQKLSAAIQAGRRDAIQARLDELARANKVRRGVMNLQSTGRFETGGGQVVAPARTRLIDDHSSQRGHAQPVHDRRRAVRAAHPARDRRGRRRHLRRHPARLDAAATPAPRRCPTTARSRSAAARCASPASTVPASTARRVQVRLLAEPDSGGTLGASSLEVIAILVAALIAAFAFAITVSRSLQAQIDRLLQAARRDGRRQLRVEVPTEGNDEFAALGTEFNTMARELETPARGAAARARPPARGDPPRRPVVRQGPRPRRGARDRRPDRGRRRRRGRAAARRCATGPQGRFEQVARRGRRRPYRDAIHAAEAAALNAERRRARPTSASSTRSRTRCAPRRAAASSACSPSRARRRLLRRRARALHLPGPAGRRLDRERRPPRHGQAPGGHRRAHRACSTTGASRRSSSRRSSAPSASAATWG